PEREEYVISTSEFQRVKEHLMKLSNAKAGIVADYDNNDDTRPTLKKRQPADVSGDDSGLKADSGSSSSTTDGPPKLKKRDPDPQPASTPGSSSNDGEPPTLKPKPTPTPEQ